MAGRNGTYSGKPERPKPRKRTGVTPSARKASHGKPKPSSGPPVRNGVFSSGRAAKGAKSAEGSPFDRMTLWTKEPWKGGPGSGFLGAVRAVLSVAGGLVAAALIALGRLFGVAFRALSRSKVAIAVTAAVVLFGAVLVVDLCMNWGKVYPGVTVGSIELGGKTLDEAQALLESVYAPRLEGRQVFVFANEEASKDVGAALEQSRDNALAEQRSVDEAKASRVLWTTDAPSLSASFDAHGLAARALAVGREDGGIIARGGALLFGKRFEPTVTFDQRAVDELAKQVDAAIGDVRVDFDIQVTDGVAQIVEGHDGNMVDRDTFEAQISEVLLAEETERAAFVARAEYAPMRVSREEAQRVCDLVNRVIAPGAAFSYEGTTWSATAADVGSWVKTRIVETEEGYALEPYFDQGIAKGIVINHLVTTFDGDAIKVTFEIDGDEQIVHTETDETIPVAHDAVSELEGVLFGSANREASLEAAPVIEVASKRIPDSMPLSEALENGVISSIASFTTEYTAEPAARQHNIHLGADLLNNSIVKANGGTWSFNDITGDYNEEAGFQGAGAISDGEYVDAVGGGICQVATTVFNAVYDSGFPVLTRHNHTLYIASYPAGRDAAVAYPYLDLVWENDSSSDVLLATSYTDTTVSVTLYGVNPEYQVSTAVGEWEAGERFKTKTTVDESLAPGTSYVKTVGADGRKISIVRTVKDKTGTIVHEDLFSSTYDPKNEVKVEGPPAKEQSQDEKSSQGEQGAAGDDVSGSAGQ